MSEIVIECIVIAVIVSIPILAAAMGGAFDPRPETLNETMARLRREREKAAKARKVFGDGVAWALALSDLPKDFEEAVAKSSGDLSVYAFGDGENVTALFKDKTAAALGGDPHLPRVRLKKGSALAEILLVVMERAGQVELHPVAYKGKPTSATLAAIEKNQAEEKIPALRRLFGRQLADGLVAP